MKLIDADALAKKCCINREKFETCEKCIEYYVKKGCSGICDLEYRGEDVQNAPIIDAIPVEWLEAQIKPYTGDASDIGKCVRNGAIKGIIRKWHQEQEGDDATD